MTVWATTCTGKDSIMGASIQTGTICPAVTLWHLTSPVPTFSGSVFSSELFPNVTTVERGPWQQS